MKSVRILQSFCAMAFILAGLAMNGQTRDVSFNVVCLANPHATDVTHQKACIHDVPPLTFNSDLTLAVEHAENSDFDDITEPNPTDLVLFLDGKAIPGVHPAVGVSQTDDDDVTTTLLTYRITHDLNTEQARKNWKEIISASNNNRRVVASTGLVDGPAAQSHASPVLFQTVRPARAVIWIILAIVGAILFFVIAAKTYVLRDKEDYPPNGFTGDAKPAFSLSRVQMAVWTMLVIYSYLLIWALTGEYKATIPASAITLMGITAATFAGAAVVDATKLSESKKKLQSAPVALTVADQEEINSLESSTRVCTSEGFFRDITTGANGASLHRLQFIVWTLALMVIFVVTVWKSLSMPDFDTTLLSLMGITSGAYVGLKLPEKKC